MIEKTKCMSKDVIIASILLALFVDVKILNLIVIVARPSLSGIFMTMMYAVVVIGLFFTGLFVQKRGVANLRFSHISICGICVIWYVITSTFIATPSVNMQLFCIFTVAAFLIPGIVCIDMHIFLLTLIILPSIGVAYLDKIFISEILEKGVVSMGTCYALLVPVLGNLVYLRFYYNKETVWMRTVMLFFAAINFYYLIQMTMYGSRGPVLCALLLVISFFIVKIDNYGKVLMYKGRVSIFIISIIILSLSFTTILQVLSDFLATFDISLNVIDKFLWLEDEGDITNGRDSLSSIVLKSIMESPILGHGVSQFLNNTGVVYPHNFILQLLYDGGIILTCLVIIPITKILKYKIGKVSESEFICLLFLFFASVPGSLFSGDLWNAGTLWMFFGFVLAKNSVIKKQNTN